jgi:predicted extracellular nuclease/alpha-tubulin suppressor-like RCC1 family protein
MTVLHACRHAVGVFALLFAGAATAQISVTEWMYDGAGGEFVELTNIGTEPVDMTGWRYDDDSADPAIGFDLSGFATVLPGQSVVLTQADPTAFRSDWGLCADAGVIGPYTNNLGRNDQINIFDAEGVLVDVLTFGDETFPGSIRTTGASGKVSLTGLGADDVYEWTLAAVGDGEGSLASLGGAVGSPARSTHGGFDACAPAGPAPVVLLAQDWTDIGQITADDNWTGVAGIVGYRGDGMAGGTAVNPQTLVADGSGTPIDVIANQINPNTLTTGGVAEFHIADPVVAFQGSGTARAPHLVLTVDTTGLTQIEVSYLLRDIDGGADNSVQPVALHYRVGTSGSYTNLPAGFVADASSGPGQATQVTPVSVTLPPPAENQPVVQVRILTTDAAGSDEWTGVDDILITGVAPDSNTPPMVDAGGPYTVETTGTITLDGTVVDPDTGDTLVVTWSVLPTGPTFSDPAQVDPELNGNGAAEGDYVLTLTVDDGSGPVSDTAVLTVEDTQPPIEDVLYINEVHYDNAGTDVGEFIELAGTAGQDLNGWSLVLYNGSNGLSYSTVNLGAFALPDQDNGYGTVAITYPVNGIQNGDPDAMALVDGTTVVQFLSYGGEFQAANGPAAGLTSVDIGVSQAGGAPIGSSLQLIGSGTRYEDFTWVGPVDASPGQVNAGQSIGGGNPAFPPVAQCPGTFGVAQGVGGNALLSASDPDDRIVTATIVAGAQPGIGLVDFAASPAMGDDATVVLQVAGSVVLGSYPTTVRFTNDGAPQTIDCVVNVTVVASAGVVPISQVQGSGSASPLAGQSVTVTAVVTSNLTGDLQGNQMGGFYIEEEAADRDANPATPEGLFVFTGGQSPSYTGLAVGDVVTVTGVAEEFFTQTQINASTGSITATGATVKLPPPVTLAALPEASAEAFAAAFEPIEGMRVQLVDTWTVSENHDLHRLGELQLVPGTQPLQTATNVGPPGPDAGEFERDTQTEPRTTSLTLDDARNGILSPNNFDTPYVVPEVTGTLRRGSTIDDLVAIMAFDFGRYRLRPVDDEANIVFTPAPRPAVPSVGGDVVIATFNVLNYFNGDGMGGGFPTSRGAETFAEFQRQTEKIVAALIELDADVVGLIEIENDGNAAIPSVRTLTEALNAALGEQRYAWLATGNRIGSDEIAQAYIHKTATVSLDGFAILDDVDPFNRNTRPPLAGRFTELATGETFVPIVNHFKSKGSGSGPGNGDAGDGQALSNADRVLAAAELVDWIDTDPFFLADDRVLVIGDINAYAHEDPILVFEDAGYVDLLDGQVREAYSYTFFGAEGRLDYALANAAALDVVTGTAAWHINSDEPRGKDYTFFNQPELYEPGPYRSSDHDPVAVGLNLSGEPPVTASIRITEWMYDGAGGEFVELTNVGAEAVDVTGWSYDDDSATPGVFDLSGFGVIEAGESVVFVESDPAAFRSEWNLCADANVIGPYTNNLGRADQINIFDAAGVRIDRLTYGDQAFPGSIRTQGASGWVSAAGLGADNVFAWTLSSVGDAESSVASVGGALGSPGTSTRASVAFDACDDVPGPTLIPATIAAGSRFACGLDAAGLAYCWGSDSNGQLGNGADVSANMVSPYPVDMTTLPTGTRFEAIVAGGSMACALTEDGLAYCWGQDNYGQLGNGAVIVGDQPAPVAVDMAPLNGAVFIGLTVGATHACGVADDGTAYCWGRSGPLGLPADVPGNQPSPSPVDMAALPVDTAFVSVDTASGHTCGLASDGNLYCWGRNDNGQLGIGTSGGQHPITAVNVGTLPAGTSFAWVTTGDSHSCALTTEDVAYCWGAGINGAVGNGAQSLDVLLPNPLVTSTIPAGSHFTVLEGGGTNTCGILDTGAAYCWGFGNWGALGTGDGTSRYSPHPVATTALPTGTVFTELSADNNLTCAATQAGEFYCWGRDDQGQQGNGPVNTADPSLVPTLVFPFVPVEGLPPSIVVASPIVVGSVGDPTNIGTTLTIADPDTDIADLVIEVTTANASVITPSGVTVTGDGAQREVSFAPNGRGLSNVTFIVTDPQGNGQSATLQYAASNPAPDPSGRYHHHISDASAALDVGDGYVILLNDETNTIFLHRDDATGLPVKTWSFSSGQLGTSSEIDFEGIARFGDQVLLTGSHGNNRSGSARPERRTFVAATISGSGADTELVFQGRYNNLWSELRAWDQSNGHGLGADALGFIAATAPGVLPNPPVGFNIEGMEFSPDGETVYLAFRAPTINIDGTYRALIVPLLNVEDLVNGTPGTGPAQFGTPLLYDLGGRSIRAVASNAEGDYLISAGPSPQNESWALYTWNGNPDDAPQFNRDLPADDGLTGGTWESIGAVPHPLVEGAMVRLITDSGDTNFYGTGATKDLQQVYQKSYTQAFALAKVPGGGPGNGIRITEWMYDGAGGEFVELTNAGTEAVDVTGWSYDDDSATPGGFDLSGFGVIEAGESVVFVESDPDTFRSEWNLCTGVRIAGPYTNNLGRADQINLFDADGVRVDRLTYGDQVFPGSIRTQGASGWVSAAGVGIDDVFEWTLSTVGDGERSVASTGGAIGSPGRSTRAGVPFEPCDPVVEYTLVVDIAAGEGTIIGDGIACPGDCQEAYVAGTQVTLTASPASGFVFDGWNGDCAGIGDCLLTMDADKAVDADFIAAAAIAVEPGSLSSTLVAGTSETQVLTLANPGGETLTWQVDDTGDCALPAWIAIDPASGSIMGGGDQAVDVTFDANGLSPAVYAAQLCIASNDPVQPTVTVPLSLTVTAVPAPVLTFDPIVLDFGDIEVGATSPSMSSVLRNTGNAAATGLIFGASGSGFAIDTGDCGNALAAGGDCDVVVTFTPDIVGAIQASLPVTSAQGASASLALQGVGVAPAEPETDVTVAIETEQTLVQRGDLVDYLITVSNAGPDTTAGASVASTLSAELDVDFAEWVCVGPAASGCTASGQGDLVDAGLVIPAGGEVVYLLSAPARMDADGEVLTQVQVADADDVDPSNDTAQAAGEIVVFHDGFESGSDGDMALGELAVGGTPVTFEIMTGNASTIDTVLTASAIGDGSRAATVCLDRLTADSRQWLRLVARDPAGGDYASRWLPVAAGRWTLTLIEGERVHPETGEITTEPTLRLGTASGPAVALPLIASPATWQLRAGPSLIAVVD